jgi:hypothetical protein
MTEEKVEYLVLVKFEIVTDEGQFVLFLHHLLKKKIFFRCTVEYIVYCLAFAFQSIPMK